MLIKCSPYTEVLRSERVWSTKYTQLVTHPCSICNSLTRHCYQYCQQMSMISFFNSIRQNMPLSIQSCIYSMPISILCLCVSFLNYVDLSKQFREFSEHFQPDTGYFYIPFSQYKVIKQCWITVADMHFSLTLYSGCFLL